MQATFLIRQVSCLKSLTARLKVETFKAFKNYKLNVDVRPMYWDIKEKVQCLKKKECKNNMTVKLGLTVIGAYM